MLKKTFWTALSSVAFALYSLITNKLFSIFFGPQGVTLLAHFQNLLNIFTTIPNEGINRGLVKFLSDPKLDDEGWNKYISATLVLTLFAFLSTLFFMGLLFNTYKSDFPHGVFTPLNIGLMIAAIGLQYLTFIVMNLVLVNQKIMAFSFLSIVNNMLGLALVYWGIRINMVTAFICLSFAPATALFFTVIYYAKIDSLRIARFKFKTDKQTIIHIGHFILVALSLVVFGRITDFFVRDYAISKFDLYQTGLWQGVVKMSDGYSNIFSSAFGLLFFVKISSLINDETALKSLLRKALVVVFIATGSGLWIVWIFRNEFLTLFYNKSFVEGAAFVDFQVLGDLFKFPSYILAYVLLAQLKTRLYIFTQAASCACFLLLITLLIPSYGIQGLPLSHFLRFVFFFGLMAWINRKLIF